jgi:hypothetical protein
MVESKGEIMKHIIPNTLNPIERIQDVHVVKIGGLQLSNIHQNNRLPKQRLTSENEHWYKCKCVNVARV